LAKWYRDIEFPVVVPRYNIAPTQKVLTLRAAQHSDWQAVMMRWGLVPSWADDLRIGNRMINARSETAATKPAFRQAFKRRRCLILADGFYEWKTTSHGKQPFLIQKSDPESPLLCFAGLWESWKPKKGAVEASTERVQSELFPAEVAGVSMNTDEAHVESCTILTTSANSLMSQLHDRMPVILDEPSQKIWLDHSIDDIQLLNSQLNPCPANWLRMHPVTQAVNKPTYDEIACTIEVNLSDN
jgi:putative SOS response-associated peptidase YedK